MNWTSAEEVSFAWESQREVLFVVAIQLDRHNSEEEQLTFQSQAPVCRILLYTLVTCIILPNLISTLISFPG